MSISASYTSVSYLRHLFEEQTGRCPYDWDVHSMHCTVRMVHVEEYLSGYRTFLPVMVVALPRSTFCRITPKDTSTLFAFWIPVIGFESLLCLLALLAGLHTFMQDDFYFRHSGKLIKILLRDSIAYFIEYLDAPIGFSVAMICTLGNRLILNIREAAHRGEGLPTPYQSER
ncbi:hypothetical protein CVT25_013003 [Psilocybe cyanescens]|uniref:Uncharacterized protein n=1 Tax=Psilocybe cyanescens TaxID=93625 RepID=A0A409XHL3_PSICY|nr:hypothetical protein CVT25_013003 [Psilocybe cyanescens]